MKNSGKETKQKRAVTLYSIEHAGFLRKQRTKKAVILSIQIGLLLFILGIWELATRLGWLDSFLISSPSRIILTIKELSADGSLYTHIFTSLYECVIGFIAATVLGVIIAVVLWWSESIRKVLDPYIVVLNSLPKIALGPIIIVWVGIGPQSIIVMAVLISVVVTVLSILNGFLSCDKDKILLMRSMGASKPQILFKLILPNAFPDIISALKINVGLAWVGTIMGEYIASRAGLGWLINQGGMIFKLDLVMTSIVILCVLATLMYLGVSFLEKRINKKRGKI